MKKIWKWLIRPFCDHDYKIYNTITGINFIMKKGKCKKCGHKWNELETW